MAGGAVDGDRGAAVTQYRIGDERQANRHQNERLDVDLLTGGRLQEPAYETAAAEGRQGSRSRQAVGPRHVGE